MTETLDYFWHELCYIFKWTCHPHLFNSFNKNKNTSPHVIDFFLEHNKHPDNLCLPLLSIEAILASSHDTASGTLYCKTSKSYEAMLAQQHDS